jgi:hypothetical protein
MKTIKIKREIEDSYEIGRWGGGRIFVYSDGAWDRALTHERDIPEDWPDEVKQACLDEILPNRELAKNEVRFGSRGCIRQLRWENGKKQFNYPNEEYWSNLTPGSDLEVISREWFEKNRPLADDEARLANGSAVYLRIVGDNVEARYARHGGAASWLLRDHDGYEAAARELWAPVAEKAAQLLRERPLEDDQTWNYNRTKRGTLAVDGEWLRITWEDGQKSKHTRSSMVGATGGDWERRRAFYDKHKPAPLKDDGSEFIDAEGRKWTFSMRDDGEVEAMGFGWGQVNTRGLLGKHDWSRAALAYRDRERAKWTFAIDGEGDVAVTKPGGEPGGFWLARRGASCELTYAPLWVREKAEKLWEENQKPKPVAENEFIDSSGRKWKFRMRDDGEVRARSGSGHEWCSGAAAANYDWSRAALAYRDRERARWGFEWEDRTVPCTDRKGFVEILKEGQNDAWWYQGEFLPAHEQIPTWVRERAHKLWEENQKPKPVAENEFIDSSGRKWTFTMRDDGEVDAMGFGWGQVNTHRLKGTQDWSRAALAYRDRERAKWTFEHHADGNFVQVLQDGKARGFLNAHAEHCWLITQPTWVREKARKLWEENQKPKRVEREQTVSSNGTVEAFVTGLEPGARVRVTIEEVE